MVTCPALKNIFLSASIPSLERNAKFYQTVDIIALRDAVRALAATVIPHAHLVWGGHPSITPLIRSVLQEMEVEVNKHVTLYQSRFFEKDFPVDNEAIENIILTEAKSTQEESLLELRTRMIGDRSYAAAIFIGGMEGVLDEYKLFKQMHPAAILLPIASTGAAARILYEQQKDGLIKIERLANDYAYGALFMDLFRSCF